MEENEALNKHIKELESQLKAQVKAYQEKKQELYTYKEELLFIKPKFEKQKEMIRDLENKLDRSKSIIQLLIDKFL